MVDAARTLFIELGYSAATIAAISNRAATPEPTIYRLFGSKLGILKAMIDVAITGDDLDAAMLDRPRVHAVISHEDPTHRIAEFALLVGEVMARVGVVHRILADAARSDPDAASVLADIARQRLEGQRIIARSLARSGALRRGLGEHTAADIIYALASPEVYGLLVTDRGWTDHRYQEWLQSALTEQLRP